MALTILLLLTGTVYAGAVGIESASTQQRNLIQSALGNQYPISKIAAVKSGNHANAYYVGAVFQPSGAGNVTGIWIVGGPKNAPKLVYSVDGAAHMFSGMQNASETKTAAYSSDPEAKVLRRHLGN